MAINFPDSPTIGDEFTGGGFTWTWSGTSWEKVEAVSGGPGDPTQTFYLNFSASPNLQNFTGSFGSGYYVFNAFSTSEPPIEVTGSVKLLKDFSPLATITFADSEIGGGTGSASAARSVEDSFQVIEVTATNPFFLRIDYYESANIKEPVSLTATAITTSQSYTTTAATTFIAAIGGGGSGSNNGPSNPRGGAGGGSGYLATGSKPPGTYSVVIGSGGLWLGQNLTGGRGGTTSFDDISAEGGYGATVGAYYGSGGAGGSSGGGGSYSGFGRGAVLGGTGEGGSNGPSGSGSGVVPASWVPAQPEMTSDTYPSEDSGKPGGVYAGGNGGRYDVDSSAYNDAATNTGGGGGAGLGPAGSGNGGSGVVYVLGLG